ncbi:MAG TPA: exodeoxyribonuclease III [Steroidobacteraceae bacterium]|nr:exodeoxyribonuclease III [Steroidobacteraceae bacterium]
MIRIASWNVNSLKVRLEHLGRWLAEHPVDAIALQELKTPDEQFPAGEVRALGMHAAHYGQKTYNGVAILARKPPAEVTTGMPGSDDPQRRVIAATVAGLRLVNVYVPNGQEVGSDKYGYKLEWLARLRRHLAALLKQHPLLLVAGDFNIAPEDRDVHDPAKWEGSVHVSPAEREALAAIMALGFEDLFRRFEQPPGSFSWWDYRMGAFRRNHGLRIDLMLASPALAARCSSCTIDRAPRAWERPSDHAPVTAVFDIDRGAGM